MIFTLNPLDASASPTFYTSFPAPLTGASGIAEYSPGLFAVVVGVANTTAQRAKNFEIWSLDTNCYPPEINRLAAIENSDITDLNGATTLQSAPHIILLSESNIGAIFSFNVRTRTLRKIIQDVSMSPMGPPPNTGINGIQSFDNYIYYTNSQAGTLNRVSIDTNGERVGHVSLISQFNDTRPDDLAIDKSGNAWVASHPNSIIRVGVDGGNLTAVETGPEAQIGPTSAAFGRGSRRQEQLLYIVTGDGVVQVLDTTQV